MQLLCGQRVFESIDMEQEEALKKQVCHSMRFNFINQLVITYIQRQTNKNHFRRPSIQLRL